jgi:hypothetical protein
VLGAERHEVQLGEPELPRWIEFVGHERLSTHDARGYRSTRSAFPGHRTPPMPPRCGLDA